ncbi:N-carbamoylputrescine amidase [Rheinheimera sp. WS51]|uniref:N-carbamoylputrescine amidase n=1 Tax=Rheinheimera sp. WS51 TaxID=3425886 RepID=UPI003D9399D8
MRNVTVAATQMIGGWDVDQNIQRAERLVRDAAEKGAQIILLQELFERNYFCQKQKPEYLDFATSVDENPAVQHFSKIAKELQVVLPISIYERSGHCLYNTVVIIDADGSNLGIYRKSHIPDGPGYSEKYYFTPGDTGFKVFETQYAKIGVGICWDQWFPECARSMALMGAELLFYPTAIGSEPHDATIDSSGHWQRTQQGHAAANVTPLIASNRIGTETEGDYSITFYGCSFIADESGAKVQEAGRTEEAVLVHTFDLDAIAATRRAWGVFRDRRIDLYGTVSTKDGATKQPKVQGGN